MTEKQEGILKELGFTKIYFEESEYHSGDETLGYRHADFGDAIFYLQDVDFNKIVSYIFDSGYEEGQYDNDD